MKDLYAILDKQGPGTAESMVLIFADAMDASDNLREAVKRRKRAVAGAMRSITRAATIIYGGKAEPLPHPYSEEAPAKHDERRLLDAADPHHTLSKKERGVLSDVLDWSPQEQLAALSFLDRALGIPAKDRAEAVEELAEHVGQRYLIAQNKCIELFVDAPADFTVATKDDLREGKMMIAYSLARGHDDLYKAFLQPVVLDVSGPRAMRGAFDERIKRTGNVATLELSLTEFKATFQCRYHYQDTLPALFTRFMDTNRFRAPLPNHRALHFLRTAKWDRIPHWPIRGYAWRLSVYSYNNSWHLDSRPDYWWS